MLIKARRWPEQAISEEESLITHKALHVLVLRSVWWHQEAVGFRVVSTEQNYRKPLQHPPATPTRGAEGIIIRPVYYLICMYLIMCN